jgi:hypothetical protein
MHEAAARVRDLRALYAELERHYPLQPSISVLEAHVTELHRIASKLDNLAGEPCLQDGIRPAGIGFSRIIDDQAGEQVRSRPLPDELGRLMIHPHGPIDTVIQPERIRHDERGSKPDQ